jgi:MFS family permease
MILLAVALLARVVALPLWGRLAKRMGTRRFLLIGGLGIVPSAAWWVFSGNFIWCIAVQFLGGVVWGAYELATQLLTIELIRKEERTSVLTLFNLVNSLALAVGSVTGGVLLRHLGQDEHAYLTIFLVSTAGRVATVILLLGVVRARQAPVLPSALPLSRRMASLRENRDARSGGSGA